MSLAIGCLLVLTALCCQPLRRDKSPGPETTATNGESTVRNVLVISVDALRADHLSCSGYGRLTTSATDALAREGTLFDRAFSTASWTGPSLASFFTSTLQSRHRVTDFLPPGNVMSPGLVSLAEVGAEHGLRTGLFSAHGGLAAVTGLQAGWQRFDDRARRADQVVAEVRRWIEARQDPFLAWMHLMEPHAPYLPQAPFAERFLEPGAKLAELRQRYQWQQEQPWLLPQREGLPGADEVSFQVSQYDGCVAEADAAIGSLVRSLDSLGLLSSTAVIVTSDHGEALGEHGVFFEHGDSLHEELLRIPLVVRLPGGRAPGARQSDLVSAVDLAPTIASLLGLPVPAAWTGRALLSPDSPRRLVVVAELVERGLASVRSERFKLVACRQPGADTTGVAYQLFDLDNDPGELHDVATTFPDVVRALQSALVRHGITVVPASQSGHQVPQEVRDRLGELGYLD